jgi:hypothetical protein
MILYGGAMLNRYTATAIILSFIGAGVTELPLDYAQSIACFIAGMVFVFLIIGLRVQK